MNYSKKNLNFGILDESDEDAPPPVNRQSSRSRFDKGIKVVRQSKRVEDISDRTETSSETDSEIEDNPIFQKAMAKIQEEQKKNSEQAGKLDAVADRNSVSSNEDVDLENLQSQTVFAGFKRSTVWRQKTYTDHDAVVEQQVKTAKELLDLVEWHEKVNQECEKDKQIMNVLQLLHRDDQFQAIKHERMRVGPLGISKKLKIKDQENGHTSTCVALFDEFIFVGNSAGVIRVFDQNSGSEMTPSIKDNDLANNAVTSISLTQDGKYMVSGYKSGTLVLWDMVTLLKVKIMDDVHMAEILTAKIYLRFGEAMVHIISSDCSGQIYRVELNLSSIFGTTSSSKYYITDARHLGAVSIAVQEGTIHSSKKAGHWFCCETNQNKSIEEYTKYVAIGTAEVIFIYQINPLDGKLNQLGKYKTKNSIQEKRVKLPYLSWGEGRTPGNKQSMALLAIAWGKVIQLTYVNAGNHFFVRDGFYCSEQEINSCHFMSDSVLAILVNQTKVKILHTKKFQPGDFTTLNGFDDIVRQNLAFREEVETTKYAEFDAQYQVANIQSSVLDSLKISNFNNVVHKQHRNIVYLCQDQIVKAKILTWSEYLKKIRSEDKLSWLTVLRVALSIYNGELKGFADLPDEKCKRETELKVKMQGFIVEILQLVILKYRTNDTIDITNEIAIKVAIEFCINIKSADFLFGNQIYGFFNEMGLGDRFIKCLEPFILSGSFKKQALPKQIIDEIIVQHELQGNHKWLEKIIQQIDFSKYQEREQLKVMCQTNLMVSALLYLLIECDENGKDLSSCIQILKTMYNIMEQTKAKEVIEQKRDSLFRVVAKEDLFKLRSLNETQKYQIEVSNCYIGCKLLWIIQMFLEGKKFPNDTLDTEQWRIHVHHIVNFVTTEKYLKTILDFDPEMFFFVIEKLFKGKPWQFLQEMPRYQADCIKADEILTMFNTKGLRAFAEGNRKILESFHKLILNILITMSEEQYKSSSDQFGMTNQQVKKVDLNYTVIFKALCSHLEQREQILTDTEKFIINAQQTQMEVYQVDEQLIINALKAMPKIQMNLRKEDVNTLLLLLDQQKGIQDSLDIKIELYLARKDYVEAFECLIRAKKPARLFSWIEETLNQLKEQQGEFPQPYQGLKQALQYKLHEIAELELIEEKEQEKSRKKHQASKINIWDDNQRKQVTHYCKKSNKLLIDWFNDPKIIQNFLLSQLSSKPEVKYHFLHTYVHRTQAEMEQVINTSVYQPELLKEAELLQGYLIAYIELMCEFSREDVEYWVSKDWFPAEEGLKVCQKHKHEMGEYKCTERLGKLDEAIDILLNAISRIDCKRVLDQMDIIHMRERNDWKFGSVFEYNDGIGLFDTLLNKAIAIAQKKEGRLGNGEALWFLILEYLQNFITEANIKVQEVNKKESRIQTERQKVPTQTKIDRLKDFVMKRISYILQLEGLDISLAVIMDRLKLEYQQVQLLCRFKLELFNEKKNRMVSYEHVLQNDIMVLFNDLQKYSVSKRQCNNFQAFGMRVNAKIVQQTDGNKVVQRNISDHVCKLCKYVILNDIVTTKQRTTRGLKCFAACDHVYHTDCIRSQSSCPECSKFAFKSKLNLHNHVDDQGTYDEEILDPELLKKTAETSFAALNGLQQDISLALRNVRLNQEKVLQRALNNFDEQLQSEYLTMDDFQ